MNKQHRKALFIDKFSKVVIYSGGIATIFSVIAILLFIFSEALPLWYGANSKKLESIEPNKKKIDNPIIIGLDEYKEVLFKVTESGKINFINLKNDSLFNSISLDKINGEKITATSKTNSNNLIGLGTDKGKVIVFQINFTYEFFDDGKRKINPEYKFLNLIQVDSLQNPIRLLTFNADGNDSYTVIAINSNNNIFHYSFLKSNNDDTEEKYIETFNRLDKFVSSKITALVVDKRGENLILGTFDGKVIHISLKFGNQPQLIQSIIPFTDEFIPITNLGFLIGEQSCIVGNSKGSLISLMRMLDEESDYGWKLENIHTFPVHKSAITIFSASSRNKTFITGDAEGNTFLHHLTSERTLLSLSENKTGVKDISYSPKGDAVAILFNDLRIEIYQIDNPHPETSLKTLFGKVWYEGYSKPEFVWQSSGGTDDYEPKFSLIPLIVGTFKGTLYAMLFAIPLALMGALYTSQFLHPDIKNFVKPTIEIMAALPSVVIGFIAGLWLAPLLEQIFVNVFLAIMITPFIILVGHLIWGKYEKKLSYKLKDRVELIGIIFLIILSFFIARFLAPFVEIYILGGDYRLWLSEVLNQQYEQRNSIIVGFAMGFAVIPIIFTICEDAFSSVPSNLTSGALALGATKWQTATKIVFPTASPGVFSAIMIGFGRAIGETMIVLMATGNTPILDLSPFNGMRTLSANIAVEIPEAPYQGTLYRILFLSATILFIFTFIINTIAELVRQKLRKKYANL